jgi:PmbA protein
MNSTKLINNLKRRGISSEVYENEAETLTAKFEFSKLKSIKSERSFGRALRLIQNGKLGFSSTQDRKDIDDLAQRAILASKVGKPSCFDFPKSSRFHRIRTFFKDTATIPVNLLKDTGIEIIERILHFDKSLSVSLDIGRETSLCSIINSSGFNHSYNKSEYFVSVEAQRVRGEDILDIGDFKLSFKRDIDLSEIIDKITDKFRLAKRTVKPSKTKIPVIFTPEGVITVLLPIIAGLNGDNIFKKISPLKTGDIGNRLFNRNLTVTDSGTFGGSTRSAPFDDEGVKKQDTIMINKGTLEGFYHDLSSAKELGFKPTGNGMKSSSSFGGYSISSIPSPALNTLIIDQGPTTKASMLRNCAEAVIVDSVLGLGQGNVLSGDFSNNVLVGFLVSNGEITGRVKDLMIFGNSYDILKNDLEISQERELTSGFILAPWIKTENINLAF